MLLYMLTRCRYKPLSKQNTQYFFFIAHTTAAQLWATSHFVAAHLVRHMHSPIHRVTHSNNDILMVVSVQTIFPSYLLL